MDDGTTGGTDGDDSMMSKIVIRKCGCFTTLEKKLASGMDTQAKVVRVVFDEQGMFVHNGVLFINHQWDCMTC